MSLSTSSSPLLSDDQLIKQLQFLLRGLQEESLPLKIKEDLSDFLNPRPLDPEAVKSFCIGYWILNEIERQKGLN